MINFCSNFSFRTVLEPAVSLIGENSRPCWKIIKSEAALIESLFEVLQHQVINNIASDFACIPDRQVTIPYEDYLHAAAFDAYETESFTPKQIEWLNFMEQSSGLNPVAQREAYKKTVTYALEVFKTFPQELHPVDEFKAKINERRTQALMGIGSLWGAIILEPRLSLTRADYDFLGISYDVQFYATETLDCVGYAFLITREAKAKNWILYELNDRRHPDTAQFFKTPLALLESWQYQITREPSPGDLVVYFNRGKVKHMGMLNERGRVISKMAVNVPGITDHEIHHVPLQYGREILFFCKTKII